MRCTDFLSLYTDYRDDLVHDAALRRRLRQHLLRCERCAAHDAALRQGVILFRRQPLIEPSPRFRVHLRCRLAFERRRQTRQPVFARPARLAATLLVAAVIFEGVAQTAHHIQQPEAPAARPLPQLTASPGYPFVTFTELTVPAFEPIPLDLEEHYGDHSLRPFDPAGVPVLAVKTAWSR